MPPDDSLELPPSEPEEEPQPKLSKSSRAKGRKKVESQPASIEAPSDPELAPTAAKAAEVAEADPEVKEDVNEDVNGVPAPEPAPDVGPEVLKDEPEPSPEKPKRKTKPLPRKKLSTATEPTRGRETQSTTSKSVPSRPLAPTDANGRLPTPPPVAAPKAVSSPSVLQAVDAIVGRETKHDPLTEEQRNMTLEEYVRLQFKLRHEEMRKEGESMIAAWEARTRDARAKIEAT